MGGVIKIIQFIFVWCVIAIGTAGYGLILFPLYYWLVFVGGDARVQKAQDKASFMLQDGLKKTLGTKCLRQRV